MELKVGYKRTEVGVIPEEWEARMLLDLCHFRNGKAHEQFISDSGPFVCVNSKFISTDGRVRKYATANFCLAKKEDILMVMSDLPNGRALAKVFIVDRENFYAVNQRVCALTPYKDSSKYLFYILNRNPYFLSFDNGVSQTHLLNDAFRKCQIVIPPAKAEQEAIAEALSDADALINSLDQLIAKKRQIKQGAMQELLTGKCRLPGFGGEWEVRTIEELADCLDHLRIPLNDSERRNVKGEYPYCGANGILDYIDKYCVDDDVILMAEDGGYFDEYATRPIAYQMAGKFWVNNHAHILKSKPACDQDFLFYSLVHKNIQPFLASGTRAKLNKSEMNKIAIKLPCDKLEQTAIATILSDMDTELAALDSRLAKARQIKQGMMQELLTGRIRLL